MAKGLGRVKAMATGLKRDPYQKMRPERVGPNVQPTRFETYYVPSAGGPIAPCRIKGEAIRAVILTTRERGQTSKRV